MSPSYVKAVTEEDVLPDDTSNVENEKLGTDHNFKRQIVWFNAIGFLFLHLMCLYGLYRAFFKSHFATTTWAIFTGLAAGQGITMGAHRLFSHKAYKASTTLRIILLVLQTLAGQNSMYTWARDHRQHHKYTDTDADPHNAQRGFFFSHIGWLMSRKHPLVIEKGRTIDMSDLESDKLIMFQNKYYVPLYIIFAILVPVMVPIYFWNETYINAICVCYFGIYVIVLNCTWLVNSWAHFFGTRPYDRNASSVQTYFVSFVSMGEGWHNFHHAFPWDYRASELGSPFNLTRRLINWSATHGLAYDLKKASDSLIKSRCFRTGDGTHPVYSPTDNGNVAYDVQEVKEK